MNLESVPVHWSRVLQALVYWISYKKEFFNNHNLTEGAIVAELTHLLHSNINDSKRIECEYQYSNFFEDDLMPDEMYKDNGKQKTIRADIALGTKSKKDNKNLLQAMDVEELIEVKRYENSMSKIFEDTEKLSILKGTKARCRLFQVIIGQGKLPKKLFREDHRVQQHIKCNLKNINEVRGRVSKKSYYSKASKENGNFVVLWEVL